MKKYLYSFLVMSFIASCLMLPSCNLEAPAPDGPSGNPTVDKISPVAAAANGVLTLTGNGLGNITSVVFETGNVPAGINPTLNTGGALIFRVPVDAVPGSQKIILKNGAGVEFKVDFKVLGLATIINTSDYNFVKDSEITLTGKNLDDVTKVMLTKDTLTQVSIVSKTATTLTLKFPTSNLARTTLNIRNAAGVSTTSQEFVNVEQAYQFYTDKLGNGYLGFETWGSVEEVIDDPKRGAKSVKYTYYKDGWQVGGFSEWTNGFTKAGFEYQYFTFWVKGSTMDHNLYIQSDQSEGEPGKDNWNTWYDYNKVVIPANVWTYFKIPVAQLKLWERGNKFNRIVWRTRNDAGPDNINHTFQFDDVMFIK